MQKSTNFPQLRNAYFSIVLTDDGIFIFSRLLQSAKDDSSIFVIDDGTITSFNNEHPINKQEMIVFKEDGIEILCNEKQLLKADDPIKVKEDGSDTFDNDEHFSNAEEPI